MPPKAAFSALYDLHEPMVHAYLLARTRDRPLAEDLVQETFLRAWRQIGELGPLDAARQRAWLVAVARNLVIDRSRRARSERVAVERLGRLSRGDAGLAPDTAEQAELACDVATVDRAIAELPEEERVTLSLQVLGGLTSTQIGEALDQPPGTVRYHLNRARSRLRDALAAGTPEEG